MPCDMSDRMSFEQQGDNELEPILVPRGRVFVLTDGTFVVQWEEERVQSLLTGRYVHYAESDYGNAITDYELNQLMETGIVEGYEEEWVYISQIPTTVASSRSYYLNTTLPKKDDSRVAEALQRHGVADQFAVRIQEIFVIIRRNMGMPYRSFDEAERARELLVELDPDLFAKTVVAFVEVNPVK